MDSQSTVDIFCNKKLVNNIYKADNGMTMRSNGGTMKVTKKASVRGYHKDVWFNSKAITNILSLKNLQQQYRVTYDSVDQEFVVHRENHNKSNMKFKMHESGLHFYDPNDASEGKQGQEGEDKSELGDAKLPGVGMKTRPHTNKKSGWTTPMLELTKPQSKSQECAGAWTIVDRSKHSRSRQKPGHGTATVKSTLDMVAMRPITPKKQGRVGVG